MFAIRILLFIFVVVQFAFLQGCVEPRVVALNKDKFSSVKEIKAAYYATGDMRLFSKARHTSGICFAMGGGCLGPLLLNTAPEVKGAQDYCKLVQQYFVKYANEYIPNWPKTEIVTYYIIKDYKDLKDYSGALLLIQSLFMLDAPGINTFYGFQSQTRISLIDHNENLLWRENFLYSSELQNSKRTEALKKIADKADVPTPEELAVINAELDYAARVIASEFIKDFTAGKVIINVVDGETDLSPKPKAKSKKFTK
jgi:hypothetical protein